MSKSKVQISKIKLLLLEVFCDVVLDGDAAEVAIIPVALEGDVGIPVVESILHGEEEPLEDLVAQCPPRPEVCVPAASIHEPVPLDVEEPLAPEPLEKLVSSIESRPPELVEPESFSAEKVLIESCLPQKGDGQLLITAGELSEAGKGPFIPSVMLCIADGIAGAGFEVDVFIEVARKADPWVMNVVIEKARGRAVKIPVIVPILEKR